MTGVLLTILFKATCVLALAWAVSAAAPSRPAASRHAAWAVALAAVVLLPAGVATLPRIAVPVMTPSLESATRIEKSPSDAAPAAEPGSGSALAGATGGAAVRTLRTPSDPADREAQVAASNAADTRGVGASRGEPILLPVVVLLWSLGTALTASRFLADHLRLRRAVAAAVPAPDGWRRTSARCRKRLEPRFHEKSRIARWRTSRRGAALLVADDIDVPLVYGLARPAIVLPGSARRWDADRLETVLLHELGHVRRRDHLTALLEPLACVLYWPHPLVWLATRRLRAERERACDELVLSAGVDRVSYAHHLVEIVRGLLPPRGVAVTLADRAGFRPRIAAILRYRGGAADTRGLGLTSAAALAAALVFGAVEATERPAEEPSPIVDALIANLQGGDATARRHAAWALGDREESAAVGALLEALDGPDTELRGLAAWALGEIKSPAALRPLVERLEDDDPVVREMAARAVGELESARAVPELHRLLRDEVEDVRVAAVWALGEIGGQRAISVVADNLDEISSAVWREAVRVLVTARSERVTTVLVSTLASGDEDTRAFAAVELGRLGGEQAISPLIAALDDPASQVRREAARSLGVLGEPAAVDPLIGRLRDRAMEVRSLAVWALDEIGRRTGESPRREALPGVADG